MRTARLLTIYASVAARYSFCISTEFNKVNKFEQVASLGHQLSLAGGKAGARGVPVRSNASWVHVNRQTDITENITFPQLRCWTVVVNNK